MYYLYRHIRTDKNQPFYIGIGKKHRNENDFRRAFSCNPRSIFWKSIKKRTTIKVEILFEHDDRIIIQQKEKEFISFYGRIDKKTGCLVNHTDGGEDHLGFSSQTIEKLKQRMTGNTIMNGRKTTKEHKNNISKSLTGIKRSPENILGIIKRNIGNTYGKANKGKQASLETRIILSKAQKGKLQKSSKNIICIETGNIYISISNCAIVLFGENKKSYCNGIGRACRNNNFTCRGYHFKFL